MEKESEGDLDGKCEMMEAGSTARHRVARVGAGCFTWKKGSCTVTRVALLDIGGCTT